MEKINLEYFNNKELNICDFIEEIKGDLLKNLSKNREYLTKKFWFCWPINFCAVYHNKNYGFEHCIHFGEKTIFGVGGIYTNEFARKILEIANKDFFGNEYEYDFDPCYGWVIVNGEAIRHFYKNGVYLAYHDEECQIDLFDKNFILKKLYVCVNLNEHKIAHKELFFKSLRDDLLVVAWHPKRVVDWCYDIEEQVIFNSLPNE